MFLFFIVNLYRTSNSGYQSDAPAARYSSSRVQELQGQVDEVAGIMKNNIQLELDRAGKLDDLQARTDVLSENSRQFHVSAKKVKNAYWWKNVKVKYFFFFDE